MLVYRNFRDIPQPLWVTKRAAAESHAELFAAFPRGETLFYTVKISRAFLAREVCLRFRADETDRVVEIPLLPSDADCDPAYDCFCATVATQDLCAGQEYGLFFYHVVAQTVYGELYSHGNDREESAWFSDQAAYADPYQLLVYREDYRTPAFLKTGVMYQILVDRFFRGGNEPPREDAEMAPDWEAEISQYPAYPGAPLKNNLFYGGDLWGVVKKLPYLSSLGVTVLYLCPIFEAYSNHKYDTGDYMKIDEMFGGRDALDALFAATKERNIRVILDGVFNHTGAISRYFNRDGRYDSLGAYQSMSSPYYNWYRFSHFPDEYDCWWGVRILPSVQSGNQQYIDFIAGQNGVVDTYMRAGASGFRLDVADELNEELLRALRRRVRQDSADGAVIGEVWEDASNKIAYGRRRHYFCGTQLDSVMNYPLKNAILAFLLHGDGEQFSRVTRDLYAHYPRCASEASMNLLGTHDTERILTVLGGRDLSALSYEEVKSVRLTDEERRLAFRRLRLGYAILCFMPGIPCIYYGDEVGMEGGRDPFNRRTFPWGKEDAEILSFYRRMAQIRAAAADILLTGYYRVCEAEGGVLVLERFADAGRIRLYLNASEKKIVFSLPSDGVDLWQGEKVGTTLPLSPLTFAWVRFS